MGVFWHNAAETWIDITNSAANKVTTLLESWAGRVFCILARYIPYSGKLSREKTFVDL